MVINPAPASGNTRTSAQGRAIGGEPAGCAVSKARKNRLSPIAPRETNARAKAATARGAVSPPASGQAVEEIGQVESGAGRRQRIEADHNGLPGAGQECLPSFAHRTMIQP